MSEEFSREIEKLNELDSEIAYQLKKLRLFIEPNKKDLETLYLLY